MTTLHDASTGDFAAELVAGGVRKGASAAQATTAKKRHFEMQFDNRGLDLVRSTEDETSAITVFRDGKRGSAVLNGRDPEAVDAALTNALAAANAGMKDDANNVAEAPSLGATRYGPESPDRAKMATSIDAFLKRIARDYPLVRTRDCSQVFDDVETGFANSRGVRQNERRSTYSFGAMFMAKNGRRSTSINFTGATSFSPFEDLLNVGGVARLMDETTRSLEPRPVPEKFEGDVIITPECLSGLMHVIFGALSGQALYTGTTPFASKKGEAIASPLLSIANRPHDPSAPGGKGFDDYGVPTQNIDVIERGVLKQFLVDHFFSKKLDVPQTAGASHVVVANGETPLSEMIGRTKRGILFSRFSGGNPNSNLDFSGIAKNSFYIENGEIKYALEETMVSGNFQELLKNIHAVSKESVDFGSGVYPFLAASGVTVSSK